VNPSHLFLGTHLDNMRDKAAKGRVRTMRGEMNPTAKMTSEQVSEAKRLRADGWSYAVIARQMGVHLSTVWLAIKGKTWRTGAA
jgi:DNA invertase Pin-like site-specific DNA recombinase